MELAGGAELQGRRLASYEIRKRTAGKREPRTGPGLWLAEDTVIMDCPWSLFRFFEVDFGVDMAEGVKIISHLLLDHILSTFSFQVDFVAHLDHLMAHRCSDINTQASSS